VFLPVMGGVSGGRRHHQDASEGRFMRGYRKVLAALLQRPGLTLLGTLVVIIVIYAAYGRFNYGAEFFPSVEPDSAQVQVRARGDLSSWERDAIVREVEGRLQNMPDVKAVDARPMLTTRNQMAADVIRVLQCQVKARFTRRTATEILDDFRERTADIAGIELEFRKQEGGPAEGKPVELLVSSMDSSQLNGFVDEIESRMRTLGG